MGELCREMRDKKGDVIPPLSQRRDGDRYDIESEEQIFPEYILLDQGPNVFIARSKNPDVDLLGFPRTDHAHLLVLEHTQELDLHGRAHFVDLVQKDGAPVGGLEEPGARLGRAGERPLYVTEQLAFQQLFRDGAAVDRNKGGRGTLAAVMDRTGDELLACAAFPQNEHGSRGCRRLFDLCEHVADGRRFSDDAV